MCIMRAQQQTTQSFYPSPPSSGTIIGSEEHWEAEQVNALGRHRRETRHTKETRDCSASPVGRPTLRSLI
jgi:hypothetical protein